MGVAKAIAGIDPGKSGSIVVLTGVASEIQQIRLNAPERELLEFANTHQVERCFVEQVHAHRGEGVTSACTFGQSIGYSKLLAYIMCPLRDPEMVTPQKWQKQFDLVMKKEPGLTATQWRTHKKNLHKEKAESLFGGVRITHANADALLIAYWGMLEDVRRPL